MSRFIGGRWLALALSGFGAAVAFAAQQYDTPSGPRDRATAASGAPVLVNVPMTMNGEPVGGGAAGTCPVVYENLNSGFFSSGAQPRRALDDGYFTPGPGAGGPVEVDGINTGFVITGTGAAGAFDIEFTIYDNLDASATPVNSGPLSPTYRINIASGLTPGAYQTGLVTLPTPILVPDDNWAIDILYFEPGSSTLFTRATHLFAGNGGTGPTVGFSNDVYWRDANGNSQYDPSDSRFFGGPPNLANFYLQLTGCLAGCVIQPGIDIFTTPGGGSTYQGFGNTPIPPNFFGPGSDPFDGTVYFRGQPLNTNPPGILQATDTIVRRNGAATMPLGGSAEVPIEIVALSLVSVQPITVTYNGGHSPELWNVDAHLSRNTPQQLGSMEIILNPCACSEGGTFQATLPVLPLVRFTRIPDGMIREVDYGLFGLPPIEFCTANGRWLPGDPGFGIVNAPPGVLVDHDGDPGTPDVPCIVGSSNFVAGLRADRCTDNCQEPPQHRKRLTEEEAQLAAHGILPTEQSEPDSDGDGIPDMADNCPFLFNPHQSDRDNDGVGDECDPCPDVWNAEGCPCPPPVPCGDAPACDVNCDGSINGFDVEGFIACLNTGCTTPCGACAADTNRDGSVNGFDIDGFIGCLAADTATKIREVENCHGSWCLYRVKSKKGDGCDNIRSGELICVKCPVDGDCPNTKTYKIVNAAGDTVLCNGEWELQETDCRSCPARAEKVRYEFVP